jgi:hypothetical protein
MPPLPVRAAGAPIERGGPVTAWPGDRRHARQDPERRRQIGNNDVITGIGRNDINDVKHGISGKCVNDVISGNAVITVNPGKHIFVGNTGIANNNANTRNNVILSEDV